MLQVGGGGGGGGGGGVLQLTNQSVHFFVMRRGSNYFVVFRCAIDCDLEKSVKANVKFSL
jgi:hypothetical protein